MKFNQLSFLLLCAVVFGFGSLFAQNSKPLTLTTQFNVKEYKLQLLFGKSVDDSPVMQGFGDYSFNNKYEAHSGTVTQFTDKMLTLSFSSGSNKTVSYKIDAKTKYCVNNSCVTDRNKLTAKEVTVLTEYNSTQAVKVIDHLLTFNVTADGLELTDAECGEVCGSDAECTHKGAITAADLKCEKDSVSYAIGFNIGKNFEQNGIEINPDIFLRALNEAAEVDTSACMNDENRQTVIMALQQKAQEKVQEKMNQQAEVNEALGRAFLEKMKADPDVKEIVPGLLYKVIATGTGKTPVDTSEVTTHYKGTLINGTEFDNSYKRNEPATFPVNGVIKGWTEALKRMHEGDKWMLYIYSDLAYGRRAMGERIPAGSTLVFEVELISVK